MPAEFWTEAAQMAKAAAIVAAVALPVGLLGWVVARRRSEPLLPACRPSRVPWGAFEVIAAFLIVFEVLRPVVLLLLASSGFFEQLYGPGFPEMQPPAGEVAAEVKAEQEAAMVLRQLWAGVLALPVQLGLLYGVRRALYPAWKPQATMGVASTLALAVAAWVVLTPLVLAFNFVVNFLFTLFDLPPESHQLTHFESRLPIDPAVFLFQVCVAAPLVEELVFRGVILSWLIGGRNPQGTLDAPSGLRPWLVAFLGAVFAAMSGKPGPVIFAAVLIVGMVAVVVICHSKRRTVSAIYSSAMFFALVHSLVWPNPIPLFVFALGLGWLAVRTRGIVVPTIVHGLFNAVSAVYVLRGGAG